MNYKRISLIATPILFIIMILTPPQFGMESKAWIVLAITFLMAIWWITEAVPIPATSLLPIILFPAFDIISATNVTIPYSNHIIYLFIGGFFIAVTIEKWNLHKRIALNIINLLGTTPSKLILGFMLATAFLSAWINNTSTTMMMVPVAISIISQITKLSPSELASGKGANFPFAASLMLGIAWSSSIGGVSTLIGTAPNLILSAQLQALYGIEISFLQWMLFGIPTALIMFIVTYLLLTKFLFKFENNDTSTSKELVAKELKSLGKMTYEEKLIITVAFFVGLMWVARGLIDIPFFKSVNDTTIGIFGALLLFIIPSKLNKGEPILDWATAVKIPWGLTFLFGGGLALSSGFQSSGLDKFLSSYLSSLDGLSLLTFIFVVVAVTVFLTEVTSNTATATLLIPIMGASAVALTINPLGPIVAACLSASCAFMLPVATPPNAVVFGSGCVKISQMSRAGLFLNLITIIIITGLVTYLLPILWSIDLNSPLIK